MGDGRAERRCAVRSVRRRRRRLPRVRRISASGVLAVRRYVARPICDAAPHFTPTFIQQRIKVLVDPSVDAHRAWRSSRRVQKGPDAKIPSAISEKDRLCPGRSSLPEPRADASCKGQEQRARQHEVRNLRPAVRAHRQRADEHAGRVIVGAKPAFDRESRDEKRGPDYARQGREPPRVGVVNHPARALPHALQNRPVPATADYCAF